MKTVFRALLIASVLLAGLVSEARPFPGPGFPGGGWHRPGYPRPYPPRPIPGPIYPGPVYPRPLPGPVYPGPVYPAPGFDVCQGVFVGTDSYRGGFVQFVINRFGGNAINVTANFNGQIYNGSGFCTNVGYNQAQITMNIYGGAQQNATITGNVMNGVEVQTGIGFTAYRQ